MDIETERALRIARAEMRRRHQWAAEERLARQALSERRAQQDEHEPEAADPGPLAWLRRLAGAR